MVGSLRKFEKNKVSKERLRIIRFYEELGEKATISAFGVDRKLIYTWKKRLRKSRGRLESLVPYSTRPKRTRRMTTDPKIVSFIKTIREKHCRIGKQKIKPLLDEYCQKEGIDPIAKATIGKVIKRHNIFPRKQKRVYHSPGSAWAKKSVKRKKRLRVKHSPKHKNTGHIQSDTVVRITNGIKDYFFSAIDSKLKFSLTLSYKRITSQNMRDFYFKFKVIYPGDIKSWQTDNGSENLGIFDKQLEKDNIPHYFIYPRCPRINSIIERYNRTVQEEFVEPNLHLIHNKREFNKRLADYIIFYNTKRVHLSLGLKSPIDYLITSGGMSNKCVAST